MARSRLKIVYEDNHLLAVAKPVGVPTMGAGPDVETVVDLAKDYLREKYDKPGNVYLGVVSRLDAPVSGVLLLARTSKAASRLTEAFRSRKVKKRYLATVAGDPAVPTGPVEHFLKKDERNQRMYVTHADAPDAQRAVLEYEVLIRGTDKSLLQVHLHTGRKHQIRVQLSKLGHPIWGDLKYGGPSLKASGIALHAWQLSLEHPVKKTPLHLKCPPNRSWGGWRPYRLEKALEGR